MNYCGLESYDHGGVLLTGWGKLHGARADAHKSFSLASAPALNSPVNGSDPIPPLFQHSALIPTHAARKSPRGNLELPSSPSIARP